MKKIKLFPKAPNKEIKISNFIFIGDIIYLLIFGFTMPFLTTNQGLVCVWVMMVITIVGIYFKIKGTRKAYNFVKQEIAAGRSFEIG
ncbi:MAG: hypothetical protein WAW11_04150 [Patescibacteria group bacterium]